MSESVRMPARAQRRQKVSDGWSWMSGGAGERGLKKRGRPKRERQWNL